MTTEIKPRVVYKLVRTDKPEDGTDVYVGSTSKTLKNRLKDHRHDAGRCNSKLYKRMFEMGIDNWKILPLLVHICDRKTIQEFERNWIELLSPDLNTYSPLDENPNVNNIEASKRHYRNSIENKTYYCNVCDKAFGKIYALKRHFNSLKHQYAYLNSVD